MFMPSGVAASASGAEKSYTLTAGIQAAPQTRGYQDGSIFQQDPIGTLTPDNDLHGLTISQISSTEPGDAYVFSFAPANQPNDDTSWIDLTITGIFAGGLDTVTLIRTAGAYDPFAGINNAHTSWSFSPYVPTTQFVTGNVYNVVIRWTN